VVGLGVIAQVREPSAAPSAALSSIVRLADTEFAQATRTRYLAVTVCPFCDTRKSVNESRGVFDAATAGVAVATAITGTDQAAAPISVRRLGRRP
jgi:hypothetical protein